VLFLLVMIDKRDAQGKRQRPQQIRLIFDRSVVGAR
jgi:hypothetical protein